MGEQPGKNARKLAGTARYAIGKPLYAGAEGFSDYSKGARKANFPQGQRIFPRFRPDTAGGGPGGDIGPGPLSCRRPGPRALLFRTARRAAAAFLGQHLQGIAKRPGYRSEEHTSELQLLRQNPMSVFWLQK